MQVEKLLTPEEVAKVPTLQQAIAALGNLYTYCQVADLNAGREFVMNELVQAGLKIQQASHAILSFQTIITNLTEVKTDEIDD
nr:MAG TPA: hypothetical protein [Caudoviricetes sp.]